MDQQKKMTNGIWDDEIGGEQHMRERKRRERWREKGKWEGEQNLSERRKKGKERRKTRWRKTWWDAKRDDTKMISLSWSHSISISPFCLFLPSSFLSLSLSLVINLLCPLNTLRHMVIFFSSENSGYTIPQGKFTQSRYGECQGMKCDSVERRMKYVCIYSAKEETA